MSKIFGIFLPIDIIAIITIIGGLTLLALGLNGTVGTILTTIVVFYFGKKEVVDKMLAKKSTAADSESVAETIERIAKEEGVNSELAVRVAKCESSLNPTAINRNTNGSLDRGLFQWNDRWHPEVTDDMAFDVVLSTRAFCKAAREGHMDWWKATKHCWNK